MTRAKTAILLLAHGTPETPEDIPAYMRNITGGRPIPETVMEEVKHRYGLIGRSPLTEITLRQGAALEKALGERVYVGMRNWHPFIAETVKRMREDGVTHAIAICLAPQSSRTSVGLYRKAVMDAAGETIKIQFVESWHDQPRLISAFAEKLRAALSALPPDAPVIFTAHSVPSRTVEGGADGAPGDPYEKQARETARLVAKAAGLVDSRCRFAFQSQGMSGGPWMGPTVEETLKAVAASGTKRAVIQPIGFVCDHVEVLYDIDIAFHKVAEELGLQLTRPESLNDSPEFIAALKELAAAALQSQGANA
jgi:ferrochelatase